ncbi:MAG: hypothetical protein CMJ23_04820 [Phycisphaerae bacterium]|nr:hypothetical protein [Phycisphaerae bacterium]
MNASAIHRDDTEIRNRHDTDRRIHPFIVVRTGPDWKILLQRSASVSPTTIPAGAAGSLPARSQEQD